MRLSALNWCLPVVLTAIAACSGETPQPRTASSLTSPTVARTPGTITSTESARGVVRFEQPRSIGTPLDEMARVYTGHGLASKIDGRLRLDSDPSLDASTRTRIRRRIALGA